MNQDHLYSLETIASLLKIPKSTLRYWEKERLIHSVRGDTNDYRQYTTEQLIAICEIKFYRDLNFSIKEIKNLYTNPLSDTQKLLENARQDLEERITQLKQIHRNLITYQQKYEEVSQLQEEILKEEIPPFKTLYYFHPAKAENLLLYLNDPSILGFVLSPDEQTIEHFSTTNKDSAAFPLVLHWEFDASKSYYSQLIRIEESSNQLQPQQIQKNLIYLQEQGYQVHQLLGRYLLSKKHQDYYQLWFECSN